MTAPHFNILTQQELTIDLSRPAMLYAVEALSNVPNISIETPLTPDVQCELDNFRNTLLNLLHRSEPISEMAEAHASPSHDSRLEPDANGGKDAQLNMKLVGNLDLIGG
jgi:hypothetical protein